MRAPNRSYTLRSLLIVLLAVGCKGVLDVHPVNEVDEEQAISTPAGARAAVAGMYDALQDFAYYGGEVQIFGDLSGDDVEHFGTFTTYRQIDQNDITSDNGSIEGFWDALYQAVGRANIVIAKVPGVPGLDPVERDQMLGEAHFIRALTLHNLVRFWGDTAGGGMGVPIVLVPPVDIPSTALATRATTAEVYTQILSDLAAAEALMSVTVADSRQASIMAVRAIRARVFLYQKNYAGAETEAEAVGTLGGYTLATNYADLFTADGNDTPEDVFRLDFDAVDFCWEGFYYRHSEEQGRREVSPSVSLMTAYDTGFTGAPSSYSPADLRGQHNVTFYDTSDGTSVYGSKYPTGIGAEDIHVIRYAEVLLIQAEAEARQNKLAEAEATLTPIRTRAALPAAGLDTMSQANAILAVLQERRLELAMEGDRWPDLVRTGRATIVLPGIAPFQTLYPIPLNELDVAPGLTQNPGY